MASWGGHKYFFGECEMYSFKKENNFFLLSVQPVSTDFYASFLWYTFAPLS